MITPVKWTATLSLFSPNDLEKIHLATLKILENTGVVMPLDDSRYQVLESHGAKIDRVSGRIYFSPDMIETALSVAPNHYTLGARYPENDLPLDGRHGYLTLDGTGVKIQDLHCGEIRPSVYTDLEDATRVADALPQIAFLWPCLSAQDKSPEVQPLYELFALLKHSDKHIQAMTAVTPSMAQGSVEMAAAVAGSKESLKAHPIISNFQCSISPLSYDQDSLEAALVFAHAGIPVGFINMQIGCATAPATLAGNIAMGNAEILSGITFLQCFYPGTPTFYGSCATMMELRTGGITAGGPDDFVLQAASSQLAHYYGLPANIGTFATGARRPGWQAGLENALSGAVSQFSCSDMMCGAGLTNGGTVFSFEQLLMDCEIFDMIRILNQEVIINDETLALDVIDRIGPQNHYMADQHTIRHLHDIWQPTVIDRLDYEQWVENGQPTSADNANLKAREILETHQPTVLQEEETLLEIIHHYEHNNR